MKFINIFQMNDWKINKFIIIIISIQFAFWGTVGLDIIGFNVPIARQVLGFIYLTFVPGVVLLRILRLHNMGNIETILHIIGLSIASLTFIGFFINIIYPIFGFSRPFSESKLLLTISSVNVILIILAYIIDKNFSDSSEISINNNFDLYLCLFPFLSIFGTHVMNISGNNILLMTLIILAMCTVIITSYGLSYNKRYNNLELLIFLLSMSFLFHVSLISAYIIGYDIQREYYSAKSVQFASSWDPGIDNDLLGSLLSISVLPTIYSNVCNLELIWVFKIIYPLIFSLVPLGLYRIFQKQTNENVAFLSSFYFISMPCFYYLMPQMAREMIAQLFYVLIILLMIDIHMSDFKKCILFIIYILGLAVSHYAISYIFAFAALVVWFSFIYNRAKMQNKFKSNLFNTNIFLLIFVFNIAWYLYVSGGIVFDTIVGIFDHIFDSFISDFLNPNKTQGAQIIIQDEKSILNNILKILYLMSHAAISLGVFHIIKNKKFSRFNWTYASFAIVNYLLLLVAILVPNFSVNLNTIRLFQISLLFLAPFFVIGASSVVIYLCVLIKAELCKYVYIPISIFLAIFFLINSGLLHECTGEYYGSSISLNSTSDGARFNECEILCAKWIYDTYYEMPIYADTNRWVLLNSIFGTSNVKQIRGLSVPKNSYIYLGSFNVKTHIFSYFGLIEGPEYINLDCMIKNRHKIYDNGCHIYN